MPVKLTVKADYLEISITGPWTWAVVEKVQPEAVALVREHSLGGVLVDCRQAEVVATITEIYESTKQQSEVFPSHVRHAVVGVHDQAKGQFYEDVAANRGVSHRIFNDIAAARDWLRSL